MKPSFSMNMPVNSYLENIIRVILSININFVLKNVFKSHIRGKINDNVCSMKDG